MCKIVPSFLLVALAGAGRTHLQEQLLAADAELGVRSAVNGSALCGGRSWDTGQPTTTLSHEGISTTSLDFTQLAKMCRVNEIEPGSPIGSAGQWFQHEQINLVAGPAWAQTPAFQAGFRTLIEDLNEINQYTFFPSYEKQNKNSKERIKRFNSEFLSGEHILPRHMMIFFTVPREGRAHSNKAAARISRDDRHGIRMLPTAMLPQEKFLERSPWHRRHCCCGDSEVYGESTNTCKWKYTDPKTKCNTGVFITKSKILSDDKYCFDWAKNPDPNDAPPPGASASDNLPRECRTGESPRGPSRFCMGEDVQRDCGIACRGCNEVLPCSVVTGHLQKLRDAV